MYSSSQTQGCSATKAMHREALRHAQPCLCKLPGPLWTEERRVHTQPHATQRPLLPRLDMTGMTVSLSVGERRRPQESAVQEGHLEQTASSSQQQLESMKGICSALLAQVDRIGSQLSGKEEEVLELRSKLEKMP